ncbi:MAG: hypothetical protein K2Q19_02260 [Rhodocyclaceae bacterium]|jgi:hypothetical protein|nr:hypothetical protein [Rhodocyclaceae bacterium]
MSNALKMLMELPEEERKKVIKLAARRLALDEMQRRHDAGLPMWGPTGEKKDSASPDKATKK